MKVNFVKIDSELPEFSEKYEGIFVIDGNGDFWVGCESGWKRFVFGDELDGIESILDNILG